MREDRWICLFLSEIVVLSILFLLYLVGAAIATVCCLKVSTSNANRFPLFVANLGRSLFLPAIPCLPSPHGHGCIRLDVVDSPTVLTGWVLVHAHVFLKC